MMMMMTNESFYVRVIKHWLKTMQFSSTHASTKKDNGQTKTKR